MEQIRVVGLDIAKSVFQVHGVDGEGEVVGGTMPYNGQIMSDTVVGGSSVGSPVVGGQTYPGPTAPIQRGRNPTSHPFLPPAAPASTPPKCDMHVASLPAPAKQASSSDAAAPHRCRAGCSNFHNVRFQSLT